MSVNYFDIIREKISMGKDVSDELIEIAVEQNMRKKEVENK